MDPGLPGVEFETHGLIASLNGKLNKNKGKTVKNDLFDPFYNKMPLRIVQTKIKSDRLLGGLNRLVYLDKHMLNF